MSKYCVRVFNHNAKAKTFSAEASDLPNQVIDQTITLVSDFGNEVTFNLYDIIYSNDADRELQYWHFIPTAESVAANPRLEDYSLIVFND